MKKLGDIIEKAYDKLEDFEEKAQERLANHYIKYGGVYNTVAKISGGALMGYGFVENEAALSGGLVLASVGCMGDIAKKRLKEFWADCDCYLTKTLK